MGERDFSFRIVVNEEYTDFEAEKFNIKPYVLSFFPSGAGEKTENSIILDNKNIILSAYKEEKNTDLIRLFNSSSKNQNVVLKFERKDIEISFKPFEVKTFIKKEGFLFETTII